MRRADVTWRKLSDAEYAGGVAARGAERDSGTEPAERAASSALMTSTSQHPQSTRFSAARPVALEASPWQQHAR